MNQNRNFNQDIEDNAEQLTNMTAKKGLEKTQKTIKKIVKMIIRILLSTAKALLPFLIVPAFIISLGIFGYFAVYEFVGTEKQFSLIDNVLDKGDDGIYYVKDKMMEAENKVIQDYYKFMAGQSYWITVGEEEEIYNTDDKKVKKDKIEDFYEREEEFLLTENLLFALDENAYKWEFKFSEQFIKPVAVDTETMDLLPLVNSDGFVTIESEEKDLETGEETGKKILSVRDYGLGSVLKYNDGEKPKEKYHRIEKIKGTYIGRDVWDSETQRVVRESINESFEVILKTEPIYLVDKVALFTGNVAYEYEEQDVYFEALMEIEGSSEQSKTRKYQYGTHYIPVEDGEDIPIPLYKYRSADSAVFENVPVEVTKTVTNTGKKENQGEEDEYDIESDYVNNYLGNFEAYVPVDALRDFEFDKRIDYDSHVFDITLDFEGMAVGSLVGSGPYNKSVEYLPIIKKYAAEFGVDPHLIVAMIAQESGGNADRDGHNGSQKGSGLMQVGNHSPGVSAVDAEGNLRHFELRDGHYKDLHDNIKWGTMLFKNKMDLYDGDALKAIQSYNFDIGIIKQWYPEDWAGNGWLIHREEARRYHSKREGYPQSNSANYSCYAEGDSLKRGTSIYGNSCHAEMVMRFYPGEGTELGNDETLFDKIIGGLNSIGGLGQKFMDFIIQRKEGEKVAKIDFKHHMTDIRINDVFAITKSLEEELLFSNTHNSDDLVLSFWDDGYMESSTVGGQLTYEQILALVPNSDGYTPPVIAKESDISSPFNPNRRHPITGIKRPHNGIDIALPHGTPIHSIADGVIEYKGWYGSGGQTIMIRHDDGSKTVYMHMSGYNADQGQRVEQRQIIGFVGTTGGSTGNHLHFEYHPPGKGPINPHGIVFP